MTAVAEARLLGRAGRSRRRTAQGDRRRALPLGCAPSRHGACRARAQHHRRRAHPPHRHGAAEAAPGSWRSSPTRTPRSSSADRSTPAWARPPPAPLQDDRILHYGQYVAVVVAETPQEAAAAARLVEVDLRAGRRRARHRRRRAAQLQTNPWGIDMRRGDVDAGARLRRGHATRRPTRPRRTPTTRSACSPPSPPGTATPSRCTTPPSGPPTSGRRWPRRSGSPRPRSGFTRPTSAAASGPGLRVWPHVILTVLAARTVGRPVKLVLTRPADVHRHRPPPQHGTDAQDRRHARRRAGRDRPRGDLRAWRWRTTNTEPRHAGHAPAPMPARTSPPATGSGG